MSALTDLRDALAAYLGPRLDVDYAYGRVPTPIMPSTVFVIPRVGADYVSWEQATFCRPSAAFSAIIIGPVAENIDHAMAWLDERIMRLSTIMDDDPTLSGRCSDLVIERVTEPGVVTVEGGSTSYSAECSFHPTFITA